LADQSDVTTFLALARINANAIEKPAKQKMRRRKSKHHLNTASQDSFACSVSHQRTPQSSLATNNGSVLSNQDIEELESTIEEIESSLGESWKIDLSPSLYKQHYDAMDCEAIKKNEKLRGLVKGLLDNADTSWSKGDHNW